MTDTPPSSMDSTSGSSMSPEKPPVSSKDIFYSEMRSFWTRFRVVIFVCVSVSALVYLYIQSGRASWNEKLTLTVETPVGLISASGVRKHTLIDQRGAWLPDARGIRTESQGEAIPLEVAPGKWLFVLFGGSYDHVIAPPKSDGKGSLDMKGYVKSLKDTIGQPPVTTNEKGEPLRFPLVTFLNIDDPDSARFIKNQDLEPFFGPGYRIVSSTVEITNEPVTEGRVIEVLDWWMDYRDGPYNEMDNLKIPDDSPRGWTTLGPRRFWSLEYRKAMTKKWENNHADR